MKTVLSTRKLLIGFPITLLLFINVILQTTSATADEDKILRIGAEKKNEPSLIDSLVTEDLTTTVTPSDLANILVGGGVTISNVTYSGANNAAGLFSGGNGIIGFSNGIILSSGDMNDVVGPNIFDSTSTTQYTPGDSDLTILSGFPTFDASILEFDFVPDDSQVFFQFVFASEEYNEFVNQSFNDVFGFFINGQNCALVKSDPISINTIHNGLTNQGPGSHPQLYRNNDLQNGGGAINTEADGLTVVLTCNAPVVPNSTNHMKLAIADATDRVWDSWVFLEAGSLTTEISITLGPNPGKACLGTAHTLVATIADVPQENVSVSFEIISGPNTGPLGSALTNADGQATFSYLSPLVGTDVIQASFTGSDGQLRLSKLVDTVWHFCPDPGETITPTFTPTATLIPTSTPSPTTTPTPSPSVTPTPVTPTPMPGCELYPIALHLDSLNGVTVGDTIEDIYNGNQSGNFGWFSWAGDMSVGALVTSLTPPGNSYTYINPNDSNDHTVSIGDWVRGRPGVANSNQVRQALDNLMTYDIIIPVWDVAQGNGSNAQYHIVDFAHVRITEYHLPGQNRISAIFQGYASCGNSQSIKLDVKRRK